MFSKLKDSLEHDYIICTMTCLFDSEFETDDLPNVDLRAVFTHPVRFTMSFETGKNSAFALKTSCFTINSKNLFYEPAAAGLTGLFFSIITRLFII